jgi:hypothetical protein
MSNSWRDAILNEFTPQVARLTLVADPDGLLTEQVVLQNLRERGFELIEFKDSVAFRFAYESKYRSHWDRGEMTDLVVVLRSASSDLRQLPFDLLQAGRQLSFTLGEIFPNLSYPVVDTLDRNDLEALYQAQVKYTPGVLGDNATKDFILTHVFDLSPQLIQSQSDLLRALLRLHYKSQRLPATFAQRVVQLLRQYDQFAGWPLDVLVSDRDAVFAFLQERWPLFLERLAKTERTPVREPRADYVLNYAGPADLPFDHEDVRVYVNTLFLEGSLRPVAHPQASTLASQWVAVGLQLDPEADRLRRLTNLLDAIGNSIPNAEARHQEWLSFAQRWAEALALRYSAPTPEPPEWTDRFAALQTQIDPAFLDWVQKRYSGLANQPPRPPVMLHHVPRALAPLVEGTTNAKIALVVMDGLALDQWSVLRQVLRKQKPSMQTLESAVFAWLPTLTCISRQATFAGRTPLYFPNSLYTTAKEPLLWTQFWCEHGLSPTAIGYANTLRDSSDLVRVEELATRPQIHVLGLVVDKVDRIMHGMELGTSGMHSQVRQWAEQGFLADLLTLLIGKGFNTFITADHGNISARGFGHPAEGVLAEVRGQRARVYPNKTLRDAAKQNLPDAIEWPTVGLPPDFFPFLAPDRQAFIEPGQETVSHGSISLEELVVPFVQVKMSEK